MWGKMRTAACETPSQDLKECSEEARGELGYIEFLQQRLGIGNIKKLLLIKESQICLVEEFNGFLYMGRHKSLCSLKSFLWNVPQLFGAGILCQGEGNGTPLQYSCLENPRDSGAWWAAVYGVAQSRTRLKRSELALGSGYNQMAVKWQAFSFLNSLRAEQLTIGCSYNCGWLWHLLFIDMARNIPFLRCSFWPGICPIFGRHFMTNFCPMLLGGLYQIRQKIMLIHNSRC